MTDVALITGASAGIGMELARIHAARGGDLILTARRLERLEALKAELEGKHGIRVITIQKDLAAADAAEELVREIESHDVTVDFLINNAGFGGYGPFHERLLERDKEMISVNVVAVVALTRLFLPAMIARNRGRILNVASMGAFVPGPFHSVYYASKAFVLSFSQAIANETAKTGVTVTALCPGATATEFAGVAGLEKSWVFQRKIPDGAEIAAAGYEAMLAGKRILIPGTVNKLKILVKTLLPRKVQARIARKALQAK